MAKYADLFKHGAPAAAAGEEQEAAAEVFTVLFVDDEEQVLNALRRVFLDENYHIRTAASATAALAIMEQESVQVLVTDHRMPGMTGAELLREVKKRWPETIRIMLTGFADIQSIMGAVNEGAVFKFITKPWNDEDLRLTISLALQQYALIRENVRLRDLTKKQQQKIKRYSSLFDEDRSVLGDILAKAGAIPREALELAARERREGELLCDALVRLKLATEHDVVKLLRDGLRIDAVDLREMALNAAVVKFLPRELCEKNRILPLRLEGRQLVLAMADPSDIYKRDNIAFMTGFTVVPMIAASSEILARLASIYGDHAAGPSPEIAEVEPIDEIDIVIDEEDRDVNVEELVGSTSVPPIVRIVNAILSESIRHKASDVHIEPKTQCTVVRYRIDGMLHAKIRVPMEVHAAVVSRIKILAKIDIAERRRPQDGRITVKVGTRIVDVRVSTMPTINGEKIVLRILDRNASIRKLEELGVQQDDLRELRAVIRKPQGMLIATGPTGSGKTTLLYSMLNEMLETTRNFETIEDPVEYFLEEANQVYIREKSGLSFPAALRATLRQDPDVILVGEIRDQETADVAFKAALTGHMVLSTLHTNSTVASITRLMDMGVKPYLIASALEAILAQRLVRRICPACKIEEEPEPDVLDLLKVAPAGPGATVFRGAGCDRCGQSGYLGRMGVFELFFMNDTMRHLITTAYKEADLLNLARQGGMKTLLEDGVEKARAGETTLEEILRVIGPQTKPERNCDACGRPHDATYFFCPFCGSFRQKTCVSCRALLEDDWLVCPACGTRRSGGRSSP